jgi:3-methyladenine DNA glycosylase AlkD
MDKYIKDLQKLLHQKRNPVNAIPMKKYMRDQFEFFGLKMDERRALCKEYMNSHPLPEGKRLRDIVRELWMQPERDFQYFAIELLIKCRKEWAEDDIGLFEELIVDKSWWDTVDFLATQVIGPWFMKFPKYMKPVTGRWNRSENMWLQRMSILFQLKYKQQTNLELLYKYVNHLSGSDEFFVQKAIGWILREYSKTDPVEVQDFLRKNKLKPLSRREAVKVMERE